MALDMGGCEFSLLRFAEVSNLWKDVQITSSHLVATQIIMHGNLLFARDDNLVVDQFANAAVRRDNRTKTLNAADKEKQLGQTPAAFRPE